MIKKIHYGIAILLLTLSACNTSVDKDKVRIKGELENHGNEPLLLYYQDAILNRVIQDTLFPVVKDEFDYTGNLKFGPGIYMLAKSNPQEKPLLLFIEAGECYTIKGKSSALASASVKGGKGSDAFINYIENVMPELTNKRSVFEKIFQEKQQNEDTASLLALDSLKKKIDEIEFQAQEQYILENKSNFFSLHLFTEAFLVINGDYDRAKKVFNNLDEQIKKSERGVFVAQRIESLKNTSQGYPIQEFMLPGKDGKIDSFSVNYKHNNLTLIDFWASWCKPCRIQHPSLRKLYNEFNKKGFEIISFSLDNDLDAWKKAKQEDQITWKQYCDKRGWKSGVCQLLNVRLLPTRFLVNNKGVIIAKNPTIKELERLLQEKINEK